MEAGDTDAADELLIKSWNETDATLLRMSVQRVQGLYRVAAAEYVEPDVPNVGHERAMLIHEAVENHREERYASAISLVLPRIDGIVADFSEGGVSFFSRDRRTREPRADVTDEATLAGHPEALLTLARILPTACPTTEVSGRLVRHGIVHGRELGYGTLRNSTQALVTLLAVITWAQPIARAWLQEQAAEREARHASSTERDEYGRRLDRRGFRQAKDSLTALRNLQDRFYEAHGRCVGWVDEIDPQRVLRDMFPGAHTRCSEDAQTYWAWAETPANYVFAVSGKSGERGRWEYAGEDVPVGGVGSDEDWRHTFSSERHPDW